MKMQRNYLKRMLAYVMVLCMIFSLFGGIGVARVAKAADDYVYFLNTEGWSEVGAYVYGDKGEVLGGWGSTTATAATELGDNWLKVAVTEVPPYSIIFFNKANDGQRTEQYLPSADNVYVAMNGSSYTTKEAAEAAMGVAAGDEEDYIYFLNSDEWSEVGAYVYGDKGEVLGGWGSTTATAATELGDNWLKVAVSEVPPYSIIFFNKANDGQRTEQYLPSADNVYVAMNGSSYTTKEAAEAAMGVAGDDEEDYIYFLNSGNWASVGAYVYGDKGEVLGGWGSTTATEATELGDNWLKVAVTEVPPYSIIFYNKDDDSQRTEQYLPSEDNIYVAINGNSYTTKEAAEAAANATPTTIYILNYDGENVMYDDVYVYAYANGATVGSGWPGAKAEASDIGDNWTVVTIPANASSDLFTIIVHDNNNNRLDDIYITSYNNNYVTLNGLYASQTAAEASVGITYETVMYYLNSYDWPSVNAYVYGLPGEALGGWPGTPAQAAPELGEKWVKVTVPAKLPFSIIFFNTQADSERAELYVDAENKVYVAGSNATGNAGAYTTKTAAELDMGMGDDSLMTTLHFYDYRQWDDINGYFYTKADGDSAGITLGAGWPGKAADEDAETGENWWKISVPQDADTDPFYAIFNNGLRQTGDILIDNGTDVYITPGGQKFDNAPDAEAAAAVEVIDDGCETGPNEDYAGYVVNYNGAGAALAYTTYEAEDALTNAEVLPKNTVYRETIQSEASGRQAVKLNNTGDYVTFTLTEAANAMVMRYSMPDSADGTGIDSTLGLYINGTKKTDLDVTSRYAWVYGSYPYFNKPSSGNAHRFFDETRLMFGETLPAGTAITLKKDAANSADYYVVDFIECELVGEPLTQPENSLSITDFGAVADDGIDDYDAFVACIDAAKQDGKEVWIPAGTFDLVEEQAIIAASVVIRGAGMWYSNLYGAGAAFKFEGTSKFFDFAMTGVSTVRDDSGDLAAYEGNGKPATNITIQNIWIEHVKVGVWSADTDRMVIQGCRIRNTYADGINLCSGTHNTTVRNNSLRNTGDDCIAIWPWLADCSNNTIEHNTVQLPMLANGIAIYGGGNNKADNNYVADIINNGSGIVTGSEFDIKKGFTGPIYITNNVTDRAGSMQTDENYPVGAIWIWASYKGEMTTGYYVDNNVLNDCPQVGITIENGNTLTNVRLTNNTIDGATDAIFEYLHAGGEGTYSNMTVRNITGVFDNDQSPEFILTEAEEEPAEPEAIYVEAEDYENADAPVAVRANGDSDIVYGIHKSDALTYTVDVAADGVYQFNVKAGKKYTFPAKAAVTLRENGDVVAGAFVEPTGGWNNVEEFEGTTAYLTAGTHTFELYADDGTYNLDSFSLIPAEEQPVSVGVVHVEAEDYTSQSGATLVLRGGADTPTLKDLEDGDYMVYSVAVPADGTYQFSVSAAKKWGRPSDFVLKENGETLAGATVPVTGSWTEYTTIDGTTVDLTAGVHEFYVYTSGNKQNIDWFELTRVN